MLDLKPVFDKLKEQTEMLKELLNVVKILTHDRIFDLDKIARLESEKAELIECLEQVKRRIGEFEYDRRN